MRPLLAALLVFIAPLVSVAAEPDLIVHNAKVITVDARGLITTAFAVTGDRISAVGLSADVLKLAGPKTQKLDLAGKVVMPGLTDSHVHATGASTYEFDHPMPEFDTIGDVLNYIAARTKVVPEGEWILMRQVFITRLRDQRYPTRAELDQVAPKHPVLFSTGPDAAVNSLALSLNSIDESYKIPDGETGYLEKDPKTGKLTGILRSCTRIIKTKSSEKSPSKEEQLARLKQLFADYNSVGLTSVTDRNAGQGAIDLYAKLKDSGELTCRVYAHLSVNGQGEIPKIAEQLEKAAKGPHFQYDNMLWAKGIKVFLDGGMLTGSAYMLKPWGVSEIYSITDPEYRGLRYIDPDKLREVTRLAMQHDFQMTAHSVGDGAVTALVDCYEELSKEFDIRAKRPCVTHCNFMSAEVIDTMHRLGIVADLQPAWLYLDGRTLLKQFGEERTAFFQPYRTLFEKGVIVGGGSDHMQKIGSLRSVNPYNPFLGMWTVLTRLPRGMESPLHPEQKLTREQALRFYTINNAWLTFEEKEKGSLEPGKLADFIVLDRDILECPTDEVREITVEQTWLGGKKVYEKRGPRG